MKLDKALDTMAKSIAAGELSCYEVASKLIEAIKKDQGIEDLYFYMGDSWFYCSDKDPRKNYQLMTHPNIQLDGPAIEVLQRLGSLINGKYGQVCWNGQRFENIEDLKRYHFTKKLAGI